MKGITIAGPTFEKRISGSPKRASSAAIVRSHIITSSHPPPRTSPWAEAHTGSRVVAPAPQDVGPGGGDPRLAHVPRRHLEGHVVGERLVPRERVALARGARR